MGDVVGSETSSLILGLSFDYHDAAAALVGDGQILAASEQERHSRIKHDASLPSQAVDACLRAAGVTAQDITAVAYYEKPLVLVARYLSTRQRQGPAGLPSFVRDVPQLLRQNLMVGYRIDRMLRHLGRDRSVDVSYFDHHRSHAAAAFYPSPFEHACIVTLDGIGEWATASIGRGSRHHVDLLHELRYPDSLGLVYSFITRYCGFRPNCDEFKVMGLAPYGQPRFLEELLELVAIADDGSMRVRAQRLSWYGSGGLRRRSLHRRLGGPPRSSGDPVGEREADLAASVQALLESSVLRIVEHAHQLTGERHLVMAGGVAFNGVVNGRVAREGPFEQVWVQPAAGDAGSAVGAALELWHGHLGNHRTPALVDGMAGAFLGPRVRPDEVDRWVDANGLASTRFDSASGRSADVARRLADGAIVGIFTGRAEFGPRALGHRSILADPRSASVRKRLNSLVKGREDFRPFAPAVLAEHAEDWFDIRGSSPYMLIVAPLRDEHRVAVDEEPSSIEDRAEVVRSVVPACTHVDGSSRVQTVDALSNPELHGILLAFYELTGCPMLVNTSFNLSTEPIVDTPDDALRTARAGGLDALVVEHHLIDGPDLGSAEDVGDASSAVHA